METYPNKRHFTDLRYFHSLRAPHWTILTCILSDFGAADAPARIKNKVLYGHKSSRDFYSHTSLLYVDRKDKAIGFKSKNTRNLYFDYDLLLDYYAFFNKIVGLIEIGSKYAFLVKILKNNKSWGMGGKHVIYYFSYDKLHDIFKILHTKLVDIVNDYLEEYNYIGIDLIQIMIVKVERRQDLEVKNIDNLKLNKTLIQIGESRRNFNSNILPLTMNVEYYGKLLSKNRVKVDQVYKIYSVMRDNKNILTLIEKNSKFINKKGYLNNILEFFEFVNKRGVIYIIVVMRLDNYTNFIEVFDLNGEKMLSAKDFKLSDTEFKREIKKLTVYFNEKNIYKFEITDKLPSIKPDKPGLNSSRNTNIGSFDVETYFDISANKSFVYALGYKVLNGSKVLFYKSPNQSSEELIINCIDSMLISKYNNFIFFVHNLGGFDIAFIIKVLHDFNLANSEKKYVLRHQFRDDRIIKLSVGIKTKSGMIKINLVDSYTLLPSKLANLARDFECETKKGDFCYSFVNMSTLYYKGNTPDKKYFNISSDEYNLIKKKDWDLKQEALDYLSDDLDCLIEIMDKFSKYIFITYDTQISEALTISRLGLNIIKRKYLKEGLIPYIKNPTIWNFIKKAYFGGISDVYIPYIENGYLYDINSEYPFVSKNKMPGIKYKYIEDYSGKGLNLANLFGFFYCKIKTNNDYLGLLPVHDKGSLILPHGEFYGTWFTEELKLASEAGYEITVLKGYDFEPVEGVFNKFVDDLYSIRLKEKGMIKTITKLLLNSPFGRLGMSIHKPKHEIVNKKKRDLILSIHENVRFIEMNEDSYIIAYNPHISKEICEANGMDYIKVLETKNKDLESDAIARDISITTAAAITAYGRICINKIKLWILSHNGKIYYSDTDCVICDIELPSEMVGQELGQLKLEYRLAKGYFITSKTYMLELDNGKVIKKAKGVYADCLTKSDYEKMYFDNIDAKAMKGDTVIDLSRGTADIKPPKEVTLNSNAYTKRTKLYNDEKLWIDTTPLKYFNEE